MAYSDSPGIPYIALIIAAVALTATAARLDATNGTAVCVVANIAGPNVDSSAQGELPPKQSDAEKSSDDDAAENGGSAATVDEPSSGQAASQPSTTPSTEPATADEEDDESDAPRVEVYIPSVTALIDAAKRSHTAEIGRAVSGMVTLPTDESDEDLDFDAVLELIEQIGNWPDTSVVLTTYTMDRDGRSRWALRVDWPLAELRKRIDTLLALDATGKLLKDITVEDGPDGTARLEAPDLILAILRGDGDGSLVASTADLKPPEAVFGKKQETTQPSKKKPSLLYCRLDLAAEEEGSDSPFAGFSVVKDIRYAVTLRKNGQWNEKFAVRWHPILGIAIKATLGKLDTPFDCPRDAYVAAAFNVGFGESIADSLTGLPPGTIGGRASNEAAVAVVPGTGFLPLPDTFFQFYTRSKERIVKKIRTFIEEDRKEREEEDRGLAWHEEDIDGRVVFWHDPSADGPTGIMPVTYRTVIFFDEPDDADKSDRIRLIVAQTSTWADDAVHNWDALMKSRKSRIAIPSRKKAHWQARISWRHIYKLAQPYLALLAGMSDDATLPPDAEELDHALPDSVIDVRVQFGGVQVRHVGPIPFGAAYVPIVMIASLTAANDWSSESGRERIACRHLRVLHHHAKLFKKDYGRWPATVAELDGYVDFDTHRYLLRLRPQHKGIAAGLISKLTGEKDEPVDEEGEIVIDDSLYVIDWSPSEWKLRFRDDEFKQYLTIYIDADGEIHREPKQGEKRGQATLSPESSPYSRGKPR